MILKFCTPVINPLGCRQFMSRWFAGKEHRAISLRISGNFVSYLHKSSEKAARNCGKESCVTTCARKDNAHLRPRTSLSLLL